jgi:uncharacterized protein
MESTASCQLIIGNSPAHGRGIYAGEFIPKGTAVIECQGILRHKDEVVDGMRALQVGPETFLAEDPENPRMDDYINHSCDPNLGFKDGTLMLFALRDIEKDAELFWDYSTSINEEGWEIPCECGAGICRGKIQSYCDLPKQERERLKGIILAYLR